MYVRLHYLFKVLWVTVETYPGVFPDQAQLLCISEMKYFSCRHNRLCNSVCMCFSNEGADLFHQGVNIFVCVPTLRFSPRSKYRMGVPTELECSVRLHRTNFASCLGFHPLSLFHSFELMSALHCLWCLRTYLTYIHMLTPNFHIVTHVVAPTS